MKKRTEQLFWGDEIQWKKLWYTPDWSLHKIKNDRDTLKKKARFNMKNVNKQKKICSNHASSFLFSPVNKSVKIEENPQFKLMQKKYDKQN